MRVLIVDDNKPARESAARMLSLAQFEVEQTDTRSGLAAVARAQAEMVILAWPEKGGAEILKRVRGCETGGHVYVVVVLDKQPASEISAVFAAGADDFLRRPVVREELLARANGPQRIRKWAAPHADALDFSKGNDVSKLGACSNTGALVAEDLAQIVGTPLEVADAPASDVPGALFAATIPLSLASDETEIRVSVSVDAASMRALALAIMGDASPGDAAVDDILRELANTAGGAVKRAGLADNVIMTTGLPVNVPAARAQGAPGGDLRRWLATTKDGAVRIGITREIRRRTNERVPAARLLEGMVVAHDLKNDSGALLVPAGTRLTSTTAERVARLLGDRTLVEVARAA
jgi:CheY-like chemotaxis protein